MLVALRRHQIVAGSFLLLIGVLAGCGHSGSSSAPAATSSAKATWSPPPVAPPDPQTLLSAGATAVAQVAHSVLSFIETEQSQAWRVRVVAPDGAEQQLDISSNGTTVLVGPTSRDNSGADTAARRARVMAAHLDYRAAVKKMLDAVPSGSITYLSLADTDGATCWEADVWDTNLLEHKVAVNATTGAVLHNKQI
ncbi:PepSY domain-containing protein [Candidatus Mycobacterium methanotrophicum]|uniref:PepSY domain-containing protein n=1 Tax=Candidatus Mycobacterium methanotrophicum TaxID=2943498 RepID=A0ABY4QI95_9MYCO|nr:PepSY domain-containing protein [Candidatus Mycobacterium methanotrophicum]UQX10217.1 PepSY domain-containing protein [Candidatus Mycobacterium methanotrophicum]